MAGNKIVEIQFYAHHRLVTLEDRAYIAGGAADNTKPKIARPGKFPEIYHDTYL